MIIAIILCNNTLHNLLIPIIFLIIMTIYIDTQWQLSLKIPSTILGLHPPNLHQTNGMVIGQVDSLLQLNSSLHLMMFESSC